MAPESGPGSVDLFGFHFPMNEAVEVEAEKEVHAKLEGNGHFVKVDARTKAGRKAKADGDDDGSS